MNTLRDHDAVIGAWLDDGPQRLPAETRQAITVCIRTVTRRRAGIARPFAGRGLPTSEPRRLSIALGSAAVVVVAAAVALNFYVNQLGIGKPPLPTTPDAWSRVLIQTPSGGGRIVSLAASPSGLLAVVGEGGLYPNDTQLAVSADGRNWTFVPDDRHPDLISPRNFGYPAMVGTDRGFLMLELHEVWMSANGYDWQRLASSATDPDVGSMRAGTVGGPGVVAVGDDKAWYSVDGSDWSLAAVPALPQEILARPDSERYVEMRGVTAAGDRLVAWGIGEVPLADNSDEHLVVPLLWASDDGRTWASVVNPQMDSVTTVTGGPGGFVAAGAADGAAAVWFSANGQGWERVGDGAFTSNRSGGTVLFESAASTNAGYALVGRDGLCGQIVLCPDQDAALWTSADGRSWARLPSDERFAGAAAVYVVDSGSVFVVGGGLESESAQPAIWISDSEESGSGANASIAPAPTIPAPTPSQPVDFTGTWEATDHPPDSSHLTMEVIAMPNGTYGVTTRDDVARVCNGVSSTMTGVAEATDPRTFVMEQPEYVCDDGSQPRTSSGPPLDEQLRNLSFSYDTLRDALFDSLGLEWVRAGVAP